MRWPRSAAAVNYTRSDQAEVLSYFFEVFFVSFLYLKLFFFLNFFCDFYFFFCVKMAPKSLAIAATLLAVSGLQSAFAASTTIKFTVEGADEGINIEN